jgi:hypothetical protein
MCTRVQALIFLRGKVVLTGAKQRAGIEKAWAIVKTVVQPFLTDNPIQHIDITSAKQANKKLKVVDMDDAMEDGQISEHRASSIEHLDRSRRQPRCRERTQAQRRCAHRCAAGLP